MPCVLRPPEKILEMAKVYFEIAQEFYFYFCFERSSVSAKSLGNSENMNSFVCLC